MRGVTRSTHLHPPMPLCVRFWSFESFGAFVPSRATVYAAIASIRLGEVSGFDLSAFNAFRCNDSVWIDIEHIKATDMYGKQGAALLSPEDTRRLQALRGRVDLAL